MSLPVSISATRRCGSRPSSIKSKSPEITWAAKDKAETDVQRFGIEDGGKENDSPSQDSATKAIPKAKVVPKMAKGKVSSKPKSTVTASETSDVINPVDSLSDLWHAASVTKAGKFAESQVWIDKELYRQIEAFNLRCGKPVPTKHVVNAILKMFMDEYKTATQKAK